MPSPTSLDLIKDDPVLSNSCLLLCIMFGLEHYKFYSNDPSCFESLMQLYNGSKEAQIAALELLRKKYLFATSGPVEPIGPHSLSEAQHYLDQIKAQLNIYRLVNSKTSFIGTVPKERDLTKFQIYVLETQTRTDKHVDLIIKPTKFFNTHGSHCIFCDTTWSTLYYRHSCKKKSEQCIACKRPFYQLGYKIHPLIKDQFCRSKVDIIKEWKCDTCNLTCYTQDCRDKHSVNVCRRGYYCPECKTNFRLGGSTKDYNDLVTSHKCENQRCRFCKQIVSRNILHDCPLWTVRAQQTHSKLGALCISYAQSEINDSKGNATLLKPNVCVIIGEDDERGKFRSIQIDAWSQGADSPTLIHESDYNECYFFKVKKPEAAEEKSNRSLSHVHLYGRNDSQDTDVMAEVMDYVFNVCPEYYYNTTFLVANTDDMISIAGAISKTSVKPNVVPSGSSFLSILVPDRKVTFLCLSNYVNHTTFELRKIHSKSGKDPLFFPERLNRKKHYSYIGNIPKIEYWEEMNDTDDMKNLKRLYCLNNATDQWNFKKNLSDFVLFGAKSILLGALTYMLEMQHIEKACVSATKKNHYVKSKVRYFNPFSNGILSSTSAIYYLYRLYYGNTFDLRCVRYETSGIPVRNCSKVEQEWLAYEQSRDPSIVTAYSPNGLPPFRGRSVPDGYSVEKKKALFFHGCHVCIPWPKI